MEKQSFPYPKLPRYWRPVFFIRSDVRFGIMGEGDVDNDPIHLRASQ